MDVHTRTVRVFTARSGRERRITGRTLFIAFSGQTGAREFSYEKRMPAGSRNFSFSLSIFVKALVPCETVEGFLK